MPAGPRHLGLLENWTYSGLKWLVSSPRSPTIAFMDMRRTCSPFGACSPSTDTCKSLSRDWHKRHELRVREIRTEIVLSVAVHPVLHVVGPGLAARQCLRHAVVVDQQILVLVGIQPHGHRKLPEVVGAGDELRLVFDRLSDGEEQRRQNRDDGNHHQQLIKVKPPSRRLGAFPWLASFSADGVFQVSNLPLRMRTLPRPDGQASIWRLLKRVVCRDHLSHNRQCCRSEFALAPGLDGEWRAGRLKAELQTDCLWREITWAQGQNRQNRFCVGFCAGLPLFPLRRTGQVSGLMKRNSLALAAGLALAGALASCATLGRDPSKPRSEPSSAASRAVAQVKAKFAPDAHLAIFNVEVHETGRQVSLRGVVDNPEARNEILTALATAGFEVTDHITVLPSPELGNATWGISSLSVANGREKPGHSAELGTQILMGHVVRVWGAVQPVDSCPGGADRYLS